MPIPRRPWLLPTIAALLAIALAVMYWPQAEVIPGRRLSAADIRALPDAEVVEQVMTRMALRAGPTLSGWRRLPEAGKHIYEVKSFLTACTQYRLADQVMASSNFPDAPNLTETAASFRALGHANIAEILEAVVERARSEHAALSAWYAYRTEPSVQETVPPDPLSAQDARLRQAMASAGLEAALCAYIRAHAEELADP